MSTMEERARADADDSDRFPPDRSNGERVGVASVTDGETGPELRPCDSEAPEALVALKASIFELGATIADLLDALDAKNAKIEWMGNVAADTITQLTKERDELRATIARMRTVQP